MRSFGLGLLFIAPVSCHLLVPLDGIQDGESIAGGGGANGTGGQGGAVGEGGDSGAGGAIDRPVVDVAPLNCPLTPPSRVGTIYVELTGDDAGDGSAEAPVATIARALELAAPGVVIALGAGLFESPGTIELPPGISLIGAGKGKTTLRSTSGGTILSLTEARDNWISGLELDGEGRFAARGIGVVGAEGLTIADVDAHNFSETSLRLERGVAQPSDITVCQSDFRACGSRGEDLSPYVDLGCLHVDPPRHALFSDLTIDTDLGAGIRFDTDQGEALEDLVVEFVDVLVPSLRDASGAPQYALTMRGVTFSGVVIRQSRFNGLVGVWQAGTAAQDLRIHDNSLVTKNVALELDVSGAEVDHNYIEALYYWIMNLNGSGIRGGFNIHHNVVASAGKPHPLGLFTPHVVDLRFTSNTVILSGNLSGTTLFEFSGGGTNHIFANNLFLSEATQNADDWGILSDTSLTHNLFYGLEPPPQALDSVLDDPLLDLDAEVLDERYRVPEGSPAALAGEDLETSEPIDLGACTRPEAPCVGAAWVDEP